MAWQKCYIITRPLIVNYVTINFNISLPRQTPDRVLGVPSQQFRAFRQREKSATQNPEAGQRVQRSQGDLTSLISGANPVLRNGKSSALVQVTGALW